MHGQGRLDVPTWGASHSERSLEILGHAERDLLGDFDPDRLSSCRVAPHAGWAVRDAPCRMDRSDQASAQVMP